MPNTIEIADYATNPAADDLEAALNGIDAIADIYEKLADEDNGWHYLVDRLREQHKKASDAMCRIFKLGSRYSEKLAALDQANLRKSVEELVDTVHRFVDGGDQVSEADRQAKIERIVAFVQRGGSEEGGAA